MRSFASVCLAVFGLLFGVGRTQAAASFIILVVSCCNSMSIAKGEVVYANDFEGAVGTEWSNQTTSVTNVGGRTFLGRFSDQAVSLTLIGLPSHTIATISYDFFALASWDGSQLVDPTPGSPDRDIGPDIWNVSVAGGPTLLNATFSNFDGRESQGFRDFPQSYPGTYPVDSFPSRTGAVENDTLRETFPEGDSVYHMSFTFPHTDSSIVFNFSGLMPPGDPENWGLDNVAVSVIPEPSTVVLAGLGLIALLAYGWRWSRIPLKTFPTV